MTGGKSVEEEEEEDEVVVSADGWLSQGGATALVWGPFSATYSAGEEQMGPDKS